MKRHEAAIRALDEIGKLGLGINAPTSMDEMLSVIWRAEEAVAGVGGSHEFHLALGGAWRVYTAFHARGMNRKPFLELAVQEWERAHALAAGQQWQVLAGSIPRSYGTLSCQLYIAALLGALVIEEALIRDLPKGLSYLARVYRETTNYIPQLCSYADGLYKVGAYRDAAEVATELHRRARCDPKWGDSPPPAPLRLAAKAWRAEVRQLQKQRRAIDALEASRELIGTHAATPNDHRLLEQLSAKVKEEHP